LVILRLHFHVCVYVYVCVHAYALPHAHCLYLRAPTVHYQFYLPRAVLARFTGLVGSLRGFGFAPRLRLRTHTLHTTLHTFWFIVLGLHHTRFTHAHHRCRMVRFGCYTHTACTVLVLVALHHGFTYRTAHARCTLYRLACTRCHLQLPHYRVTPHCLPGLRTYCRFSSRCALRFAVCGSAVTRLLVACRRLYHVYAPVGSRYIRWLPLPAAHAVSRRTRCRLRGWFAVLPAVTAHTHLCTVAATVTLPGSTAFAYHARFLPHAVHRAVGYTYTPRVPAPTRFARSAVHGLLCRWFTRTLPRARLVCGSTRTPHAAAPVLTLGSGWIALPAYTVLPAYLAACGSLTWFLHPMLHTPHLVTYYHTATHAGWVSSGWVLPWILV